MATDKSMGEILALLTKVSDKLGANLINLEKKVQTAEQQPETKNKQEQPTKVPEKQGTLDKIAGFFGKKTETPEPAEPAAEDKDALSGNNDEVIKKLSNIEKLLGTEVKTETEPEEVEEKPKQIILSEFGKKSKDTLARLLSGKGKQQDKPEEVVQEEQHVVVSEFGKKAENTYDKLGKKLEKIANLRMPKNEEDKKEDSEVMKYVKLLIGPALLVLGGIASFVMGLFNNGPLKGLFTMLGKVGIKGGLFWMAKKLGETLGPKVLKKIPIVGTVLGLADAYSRFKSGDMVGGVIALISGLASLLDLAVPGLGTTLSLGLDIMNSVLDAKANDEKDPTKRTAKKLGILKDWAKAVGKFIYNIPVIHNYLQAVEGWYDIVRGDYKSGFNKLAYAIPGFGFFAELAGAPATAEEATKQGMDVRQVINKTMQPLYKMLLNLLPASLRSFFSINPDGSLEFDPSKGAKHLLNMAKGFFGFKTEEEDNSTTPTDADIAKLNAEKPKPATATPDKQPNKQTSTAEASDVGEEKTSTSETTVPEPSEETPQLATANLSEDAIKDNSKLLEKNNGALENLTDVTSSHLSKQTELLAVNNRILISIKDALANLNVGGNSASVINHVSPSVHHHKSIRNIQARGLDFGSPA